MKKVKINFKILIAILMAVCTSCNKDDIGVQLLETISINGKLIQKFIYDERV